MKKEKNVFELWASSFIIDGEMLLTDCMLLQLKSCGRGSYESQMRAHFLQKG